jgi:hypothetical protein
MNPTRSFAHVARVASLAGLASLACEQPPSRGADTTAEAPGETPAPWTVDAQGIGRIRTGITVAQLGEALGAEVKPVYDFNPSCTHVTPSGLPAGVRLMIVDDTVARVEIDSAGILTAEGAGVGDTESSVILLYQGRVEVQPHKYTGPTGHYLVVTPPDDTMHRIIFETDGERILRYRAGRIPAVQAVEGCA